MAAMFARAHTKVFMIIVSLAGFSEQRSIRRQLDSLPSTLPPASIDVATGKSFPVSERSLLELPSQASQRENELHQSPSAMDVSTVNQILDLLTRDVSDQNLNSETPSGTGALTTGDPKVDELLAALGEPSENSKAIWMALLHGLMSDGSLNELLGNFIQESPPSAKREGPFEVQEGLGQPLEEQQFVDQLEGPIPQTQMEEFILEPHLGPAIMPFELPEGFFVSFLPRRAFGVVNGVSRPAHGHGSFYVHRPPGLVDVINPPAFGYLFNGYRRFQPGALPLEDQQPFQEEVVLDTPEQ